MTYRTPKRARRALALALLVALALVLAGCRNETQNRIRRNLQDLTGGRMYITLYTLDGSVVYEGVVDGKVTRAAARSADGSETASGSYVYWFDERGRYHQSDLPYLVTGFDRSAEPTP